MHTLSNLHMLLRVLRELIRVGCTLAQFLVLGAQFLALGALSVPSLEFLSQVSWVLTWYSHNIADAACVARLFDFFIFSPPTMYACLYQLFARHSSQNNRQIF